MSNAMTIRCDSGIYSIKFHGRIYIGSAIDIQDRWRCHLGRLRLGKHHSAYLQRAFNKFPEEQIAFEVVEFVADPMKLIEREQFYLDLFQPFGKRGYNSCRVAGSVLGRKWNADSCLAAKNRNQARYMHAPTARAKASASRRGTKVPAELAARRAESFRKTIASRPDWGKWNCGVKKTPEHVEKMRQNAIAQAARRKQVRANG